MDRRQKRTRQAIYNAFTRILAEKSFANITVQEIIDEADIGRSTFYSHFETKDELLKSLSTEIFEHVFSDHLKKEATHDFSGQDRSFQDEVTHILYHIYDSKSYIKGLLSCESGDIFMRYFKEYMNTTFQEELLKHKLSVPTDYMLNHLVCDFAETVRWWMKNESYTPEEISSFFFTAAPL